MTGVDRPADPVVDDGLPADALAPVRPAYGHGSLAELLPSVGAVLGIPGAGDTLGLVERLPGVRRVAVLLVDGLGHRLLPLAAASAPLLADAVAGRSGELRPLTAALPSTTPTSLVTLGTGAPPGSHGIVGFSVNVPGTDRVLNHIDWRDDPDPRSWQPLPTRLAAASAAGVAVEVVARGEFMGSGLTESAWRGGRYRPADDPDTLVSEVLAALSGGEPPVLVYGYHPDLDRVGHRYGVGSAAWHEAATGVDRLLARLLDGLPRDAALLVTGDHGQLNVPADQRTDLDADPALADGVTVVAGEPRFRHLHTLPGAAPDVVAAWRGSLGDRAWVAGRQQVVEEGWFGPVDPRHLPRIGDVVVVCSGRQVVLAGAHEQAAVAELVGFHGSWTAAELLVPLWQVTSDS